MAVSTWQAQALAERVARCLRQRLLAWRPVTGGYTTALRLMVTCADGTSVFVKGATDALTATWLRTEYGIYSQVQAPFLPTMYAWEDDGSSPFLVLEDLSGAVWQAPWTIAHVMQVLDTLGQVAATPPPARLGSLEERRARLSGWAQVAQDPAPFLGLGLCSATWLADTITALVAAEAGVQLTGEELVHGDVRSDNLCFVGDRAVLVDWNWACRGNGTLDIAAWLPSLHLEGGPLPDTILPAHPHLAALISGYFAARAGLPVEQASAQIRALQLAQLRVALPWVVRALGLPPLEGETRASHV
jgi:aminoglycoside phosphotransferase (APT) family kinase protein